MENSKRGFWKGLDLSLLISGYNFSDPQFSPDGNFIAYLMGDENGKHIWIFDINLKSHAQLTFDLPLSTGTAYGGRTFGWSSDSSCIFFSSNGNLYKVNSQGGIPVKLQSSGIQFSPYSNNDMMIFSVEHDDHMSLGILSDDCDKYSWPMRLPINENFLYDANFHPTNGSIVVHLWSFPNMSWNGSRIELLVPKNNDYSEIDRIVVAGSDTVATSQPRFSPDGKYISYLSEVNGWLNLWIAEVDGSNARSLVNEEIEHAYSTWVTGNSNYTWINNEKIVFTRNRAGFFNLALVDINTQEVIDLDLPNGFYSKLNSTGSSSYFVCEYQDHYTQNALWLVDLDMVLSGKDLDAKRHVIKSSGIKYSEEIVSTFVKPKLVTFPTSDGKEAHGLLYLQSDKENFNQSVPMIIGVHGGPTGMRTNNFNLSAQYFASRGYGYFAINYRGSVGFGRDYREILNGNWGLYDVNDCVDAVKYFKKEKIIDQQKIAIMGGSAGGFTVLMALAKYPGKFKAGIDLFGVADNFLLAEETHYLEKHYPDTLLGKLPEASPKYFKNSPIFLADKIVDPLLILQGVDDPVVLKNQSELIMKKVKGIVESKFYEGEGHGFRKKSTLKDMYSRIDKFLKRHVIYSKE